MTTIEHVRDRFGTGTTYAICIAVLIAAWIAVPQTIAVNSWANVLIPAVIWNALSFLRLRKLKWIWIHLAPYLTILGIVGVTWGLSASEGQYAFGGHPPTTFDVIAFYAGLPMIPAWPLATILLCFWRAV